MARFRLRCRRDRSRSDGKLGAGAFVGTWAKVIGFEAFSPAHGLSSSHGDSRIIRLGYFEDPSYVPLLRRAYENWRALERETGRDILTITGVLQIGRPDGPIVSRHVGLLPRL